LGKRPLLYTIFTVPPVKREQFLHNPKLFRSVISALWINILVSFRGEYALAITHPVGDDASIFYPHLNLLWVQHKGSNPVLDLDELRAIWAGCLDYDGPIDVFHEFSREKGRIWHYCAYNLRVFPGWATWIPRIQWFGSFPKCHDVDAEHRCPVCRQTYIFLGFVSVFEYEDFVKKEEFVNSS